MLVVEKDPGLLSAPGITQPDCLITRITSQTDFQNARIVHRLVGVALRIASCRSKAYNFSFFLLVV